MVLDVLLILAIAGLVVYCACEGLIRSAIMLATFYVLCMAAGMLVMALHFPQFLGDVVVGALDDVAQIPVFYQGLIFVIVLIPAWLFSVLMIRIVLGNTSIRFLSWGDNVLGALVGVILALIVSAVICNSWGVLVSQRWPPDRVWLALRKAFDHSILKPTLMDVLRIYRRVLFPFARTGYPVFFVPQG